MSNSVRDVDRGWNRIRGQLTELRGRGVNVGINDGESEDMLTIGVVHEYGAAIDVTPAMRGYLAYIGIHLRADTTQIIIPERSYIRSAYEKNLRAINRRKADLIGQVIDQRMTADQALGLLGEMHVEDIRARMVELRTPELHPVTERRKGSSNPLVDNGDLSRAINWEYDDSR